MVWPKVSCSSGQWGTGVLFGNLRQIPCRADPVATSTSASRQQHIWSPPHSSKLYIGGNTISQRFTFESLKLPECSVRLLSKSSTTEATNGPDRHVINEFQEGDSPARPSISSTAESVPGVVQAPPMENRSSGAAAATRRYIVVGNVA